MPIARRSLRTSVARAGATAGLLALMAAAVSCSGDGKTSAVATGVPATQPAVVQTAPDDLGRQIGDLYVRALSEVTDLLRDRPPASQAAAGVRDLKESYVQRLVKLGRAREALAADQRAAVDAEILAKVSAVAGESWYSTYDSLVQHYFAQDKELHALVISFNVIGQYANFDLLKKQEPQEAQRLLID